MALDVYPPGAKAVRALQTVSPNMLSKDCAARARIALLGSLYLRHVDPEVERQTVTDTPGLFASKGAPAKRAHLKCCQSGI